MGKEKNRINQRGSKTTERTYQRRTKDREKDSSRKDKR
jgi:hypothetical protein